MHLPSLQTDELVAFLLDPQHLDVVLVAAHFHLLLHACAQRAVQTALPGIQRRALGLEVLHWDEFRDAIACDGERHGVRHAQGREYGVGAPCDCQVQTTAENEGEREARPS